MSDEEKEETSGLQPEKMKVNELKTLLNERGLDTKGVKAVLVSRLRQALIEEEGDGGGDEETGDEIKIDIVESLQEEEPTKDERIIDTGQATDPPLQLEGIESSVKVIEDSDHRSELMALIDRAADDKSDEMEMSSVDLIEPSEKAVGAQEMKSDETEYSSVNTTDVIGALDKNLEKFVETHKRVM